MGRFFPIYVRRSDGKLNIATKGHRQTEVNQPTDEQLDQKPDKDGVSDFYREIAPEEPKHLDWRRKLGGMLARELNVKAKDGDNSYILATLPENYRLYEHVKKTIVNGKTEVKNKTHGAGGNDRQDAYLYGHPAGRRKRFRSPHDFFPHVLWLTTDETGDPDNCTCKICSPEDLENIMPNVTKSRAPEFKPTVGQAAAARPASAQSVKVKPEPTPPASVSLLAATTPGPRPLIPTPLPLKRSQDQFTDSQYRSFMYRPGELIWFQKGQAWGLGIILRRWSGSSTALDWNYLVQPLSHPPVQHSKYPTAIVKSSEMEMRPWLAWSVPKFTNDGLNNISPPPQFETTDWQGVKDARYGTGDMEVDGSILAAKMIDSTYTPFSKVREDRSQPMILETHYDGVFLGAEKIWAGEPIRIHIGTGIDIMVVNTIIERQRTFDSAQLPPQILGDVYRIETVPHQNGNVPTPASSQNNPHLPTRLTEDLNYRNARSIPARRVASFWKLVSPQVRIELNDVKGRWYEASLTLPILQPAAFKEASQKGEIQEASLWMNSRGDCVNANRPPSAPRLPRPNIRVATRKEACGKAVPSDLQISDGSSSADAGGQHQVEDDGMVIDPRFETADGGSADDQRGFEELMNLDGMDEAQMAGFGQGFGSQGQNHGSFF